MHRCIGFEHPETTFAHLDVPRWGFDGDTAARAVDILLGEPAAVALRDDASHRDQCYERVLTFDTSTAEPLPRSAFDNVVITGSGAVGLELAQFCAARGARRMRLLPADRSRRPPSMVCAYRAPTWWRCHATSPTRLRSRLRQRHTPTVVRRYSSTPPVRPCWRRPTG